MTLPAPGLFSTITVWPSVTDSLVAIMRAITSGLAPADCETMKVTGRCGQLCAPAGCTRQAAMNKAARVRMRFLRIRARCIARPEGMEITEPESPVLVAEMPRQRRRETDGRLRRRPLERSNCCL